MNRFLTAIVVASFLLIQSNYAETITEPSFSGHWCGKWDNIYAFCLLIDKIELEAKYRWQEYPNGKFKKSTKKIERVNRNTLKIDNIWFVLDESDLNQANAIGVFRIQTRVSQLKKTSLTSK